MKEFKGVWHKVSEDGLPKTDDYILVYIRSRSESYQPTTSMAAYDPDYGDWWIAINDSEMLDDDDEVVAPDGYKIRDGLNKPTCYSCDEESRECPHFINCSILYDNGYRKQEIIEKRTAAKVLTDVALMLKEYTDKAVIEELAEKYGVKDVLSTL